MFNLRERSQQITFLVSLFIACLLLCGIASAAPCITLSKKSGPPTSRILVSGRGFKPNVGVDIFFDTKDKALVVTNGKGEFHDAGINAPRSARPGKHWVTALERNNDKGAQKPFLVFTDWPQAGFDPSKSGVNPYENVLDNNTVRSLKVGWSHRLQGRPFGGFSSVVVSEGVAYASYLGGSPWTLYAFTARTGAVLWTYPHAASSPAVRDGVVYVYDGVNLNALDAHTGRLLWTYTIYNGTTWAPPTVANGRVFVGAGTGILYALDATTGAFLWEYNMNAGSVYGAPAVANGIVYSCTDDDSGPSECYALDERSGSPLWNYATGAPGNPAVANGLVFIDYVGTYALDATTGALVWKYAQDTGLSSPAVANGTVYTGGAGDVNALDAYTGTLVWSSPTDGSIACQPAVANGVVYATSQIGTFYAFDASTGNLLWSYSMGALGYSCPIVTNGEVYASGFTPPAHSDIFVFRSKQAVASISSPAAEESKRPDLKTLRPDFKLKVSQPGTTTAGIN